jgi:Phage tail lysozyme
VTAANLDLKNPGGKEIAVFGGGALLLALIYFALSKKTPATAATPSAPATGGGLGSTSTTPAAVSAGMGSTGNIFTDIIPAAGVPAASTAAAAGSPVPSPSLPLSPVSQGAHNLLSPSPGTPSSGPPVSGVPSAAANVSAGASAVYQALRTAGLTAIQAAGIMGNIQNESNYRVDISHLDSNGKYSYGLVQWNAASHANASSYVTGNIAHDLATQIASIVRSAKSIGLTSSSPAAAASQWAAQFENCKGCQPGGSQNSQRQFNATLIYQNILSGLYNPKPKPKPKPVAKPSAGVKAATPAQVRSLFPVVKPKARPKPAAAKKAVVPARLASIFRGRTGR